DIYKQVLDIQSTQVIPSSLNERRLAHTNAGLSWAFQKKGLYNEALDYSLKAFEIKQKHYPTSHPAIIQSLNFIGSLYEEFQGQYDLALSYFNLAYEHCEKAHKQDHPHVGDTLSNIGTIHLKKGDYDIAYYYFDRALNIREKRNKQSLAVASSLDSIGNIHRYKKQYDQALKCHFRALNIHQSILKSNDLTCSYSQHHLGNVYYDMNNFELAKFYLQQAYETKRKCLGDEHLSTCRTLCCLAPLYDNDELALNTYQKVLNIQQQLFPKNNHPDIGITFLQMGNFYRYRKMDYHHALECYAQSFNIKQKLLGDNHPETIFVANSIECMRGTMGYDQPCSVAYFPERKSFISSAARSGINDHFV
ncbi:unnamed protein product, partial [Didymodactylos carnosus]